MKILEIILKILYLISAYFPRKLPSDQKSYEAFKKVLTKYYGVPDTPQVWRTVAGHITSHKGDSLRRSWGSIANAAKRLKINELARSEGDVALKAHLEAAMKEHGVLHDEEAKEVEPSADASTKASESVLQEPPCGAI